MTDYLGPASFAATVSVGSVLGPGGWSTSSSSSGSGAETWGSGQAVGPRLVRGIAVRGTVFNVSLKSNGDGDPWTVYRLAAHLSAKRTPSVVRNDD